MSQTVSPLRRRTPEEREAYLQGMEAGINLLVRQLANQPGIELGHYAVSGPISRARRELQLVREADPMKGGN